MPPYRYLLMQQTAHIDQRVSLRTRFHSTHSERGTWFQRGFLSIQTYIPNTTRIGARSRILIYPPLVHATTTDTQISRRAQQRGPQIWPPQPQIRQKKNKRSGEIMPWKRIKGRVEEGVGAPYRSCWARRLGGRTRRPAPQGRAQRGRWPAPSPPPARSPWR